MSDKLKAIDAVQNNLPNDDEINLDIESHNASIQERIDRHTTELVELTLEKDGYMIISHHEKEIERLSALLID